VTSRLISAIGPPAVGKTTLAERLSTALPARLILEDYAGNPFLAESYAGRDEARLPGQLYFLMSRVSQLDPTRWEEERLAVSDYGFCQDAVFAELRLGDDDLRTYRRVLRRVGGLVHPPDVLVHLDAGEQTLLERIARRGREYEKAMTAEFLGQMRRAYNEVAGRADCPVIAIDCDGADICRDEVLAGIMEEIRENL